MMKNFKIILALVAFVFSFCTFDIAEANVTTNVGGFSNGATINDADGPRGIRQRSLSSDRGGSIRSARAKARFTSRKVNLGNRVIAARTAGDQEFTHVDANSVFAGTARFISNDGNPVDNFTIGVKVKGNLACRTPNPNVPDGFSVAAAAVDLIIDNTSRLAGSAWQDGTGLFTPFGEVGGAFTTSANRARINRTFPINLGTLVDGQRLSFFFAGSTLVSFAPDVPISFCRANFFRTSSFKEVKKQGGKLEIEGLSKTVDLAIIDDPNNPSGPRVLLMEGEDDIINNIEPGSVKVLLATVGSFDANTSLPGDNDQDGIADVIVTVPGQPIDVLIGGNNTLYVFGATTTGETFLGIYDATL